jgi:hypothetical protein
MYTPQEEHKDPEVDVFYRMTSSRDQQQANKRAAPEL